MKKYYLSATFVLMVVFTFSIVVSAQTDSTAPVITNVRHENVISSGAQIKWTTDDLSDSRIYYGTTPGNYSLSTTSRCDAGGNVAEHCLNLTGLAYNTVYYYMVISTNTSGLYTQRSDFQFTSGTSSSGGGGGGSGSVQLGYPNGGQCYMPGDTVNLNWSKSGSVDHVALYFSPNGYGTRPTQYFYMATPAQTYYAWTVPNNMTSQGVIWIVSHDINHVEGVADTNDSYFYISSSCYVTPTPTPTPSYSPTPTPTPTPTPSPTVSGSPQPSPEAPAGTAAPSPSTTPIYDQTYKPLAPSNFQAVVAGDKITLTWIDVADEEHYGIYRKLSGGAWLFLKTVSANTVSYVDDNVPVGSYEYDANACNSWGCSAYSNIAGAMIGAVGDYDTKTLSGTVYFSNGQPVTDAEVGAYSQDTGFWTSRQVNSSGYYSFTLSGGKWQIAVRPKDPQSAKWTYSDQFSEVDFVRDSSSETKTVNFTIPSSDNKLSVLAVDNEGMPIANAGIVVDTISAGQSSPTTTNSGIELFAKTDPSGQATFNLRNGTYYIRGFLSYESGYINPSEQSVTLLSGESKSLKIVFTKKTELASIFLEGKTRLENGDPAEAFIWAWSEKGGFVNSRSASDGTFKIQITGNSTWHIGAGREIDLVPYKSSEIGVYVANQTLWVELILLKYSMTSLAPKATNTQLATQEIITHVQDGTKVIVPANAVATTSPITVEVKPTIEVASQPSSKVVGNAYDVSVKNPVGMELREFGKEITIELPYKDSDLTAQGVTADNIAPSYFDETTSTWVKVDNYTVDKARKVIIARVKHLTLFAIVLAADIVPPSSPTSVKASALGQGLISLTWTNPSADLDHINIYRSENPGSLGRFEGTTKSSAFTNDIDIKNGITYYYVVRSVDSAGNETSNTTPTAVKAVGDSLKTSASSGLKEGDMISAAGSDDPDIYIINPHGYKRLFLNPVIFSFYGHLGGYKNVKSISASTRNSYTISGLFRNCEINDLKVYGVEVTGEDSGSLHWINISGDQAVAEDANFFKKVFCINNNEFNWYNKSSHYSSLGQVPNYSR